MVVADLAEGAGVSVTKKGFSSLWAKGEMAGEAVIFLMPQTFMNRSGEAVRQVMDYYAVPEDELVVVHDDLDLSFGRIKVDYEAGAGGHRGVADIIEKLGHKKFHRVRMGIGRPEKKEEVESFVLSSFRKEEKDLVEKMKQEAVEAVKKWIVKEAR